VNSFHPSGHFDYIFCGTGASASLVLLEMHQANLMKDATVLLIDRVKKDTRDKTFCFWSQQDEPIGHALNPIISHAWESVILPNGKEESLFPFRYNHISSIDLYKNIDQLSVEYQWTHLIAEIDAISEDVAGPFIQIEEQIYRGGTIFDSRTPIHAPSQAGQTHIHQSFVGWMIETPSPMKASHAFRFMDFNIAQSGHTQFVYVLPFSPTTALVEVTRFGAEILQTNEAEELLEKYMSQHFGNYTKLGIEKGCIPMSNAAIETLNVSGVVHLGARNYNIKPSTGYAFKNMYYHAREVAETIQKGGNVSSLNIQHVDAFKGRFAFYDTLLLDILKYQPHEGKRIFLSLFESIGIQKVMRFLDESTHLREDISIFIQLPWKPFLASLARKSFQSQLLRPILLTLLTLLLLVLGFNTEAQRYVSFGVLALGFITVGIPHGAVDHLLESRRWEFKKAPSFIIRYLALIGVMALVWMFNSTLGLSIFLLYSSWHFGQADGVLWKFSKTTSFLWGASVLLYLLGTHLIETNAIIGEMGSSSLPFTIPVLALLPWWGWAIFRKQYAFVITVFWLMLGSQIPLIIAFGLYFIGQHSLTGWQHIQRHLKLSHKAIWLHSLPFHLGAWIILGLFYFIWSVQLSINEQAPWGVFFIFISCISFPHILAMQSVYRDNKD
jgi:lycopene beta-cyclase